MCKYSGHEDDEENSDEGHDEEGTLWRRRSFCRNGLSQFKSTQEGQTRPETVQFFVHFPISPFVLGWPARPAASRNKKEGGGPEIGARWGRGLAASLFCCGWQLARPANQIKTGKDREFINELINFWSVSIFVCIVIGFE